jgi:hypothetical protein
MSAFVDVQQFARQHTACGGLTPTAQSRPGAGGGYLLTITCACGAVHDRWVTADEASQPLPPPSTPPAPPRTVPIVPGSVRAWPVPTAPPAPRRIEVALPPARRTSRGRAVWVFLALLVGLGGGSVAYLTGPSLELPGMIAGLLPERGEPPAAARAAASPGPPTLSREARRRAALDDIVTSLRQLQAEAAPTISLNDYASRVASARVAVERAAGEVPEPAQGLAREILDVHRLAGTAWRARTLNDRDEWEFVGGDPAIGLCPEVRRAVDAAASSAKVLHARARGEAVGAALQPLWECAAEKTAVLARSHLGS